MQKPYGQPFSGKTVPDIYLNIGHFLDHFIMLIFASTYDAGRSLILVVKKLLHMEHLALFFLVAWHRWTQLADKFSRY